MEAHIRTMSVGTICSVSLKQLPTSSNKGLSLLTQGSFASQKPTRKTASILILPEQREDPKLEPSLSAFNLCRAGCSQDVVCPSVGAQRLL